MLPKDQAPPSPYSFAPAWVNVALLNTGSLGTDAGYQTEPSSLENCALSWAGGPLFPYSGFEINNTPPPGFTNGYARNWCVLRGYSSIIGMLNKKFLNSGQVVPNTWLVKVPKFTARAGTYFIPGTVTQQSVTYANIKAPLTVAEQVVSWEPVGYHSAINAIVNQCTYFLPTDNDTLLAPIFSATPNSTTVAPIVNSISASYLGQGSSTAIEAATTSNPEEYTSHKGADANKGVIEDTSKPPPQHLEKKITEKITNMIGTDTGEKVKKGVSTAINLVEKVGKIATSV